MDGDARRTKLRSFALGGMVGVAGAAVAARRRMARPARAARQVAPGLAAFEDAPCFLETMSEEARRQRGGDTDTGTS